MNNSSCIITLFSNCSQKINYKVLDINSSGPGMRFKILIVKLMLMLRIRLLSCKSSQCMTGMILIITIANLSKVIIIVVQSKKYKTLTKIIKTTIKAPTPSQKATSPN